MFLEFARDGIYSLKKSREPHSSGGSSFAGGDLTAKTFGDQVSSVFERMSPEEIGAMFEREGDQVSVEPPFREG
jgi:hypothetical protein